MGTRSFGRLYYYLIGIAIVAALPWLLGLAGDYWVMVLVLVGIFGIYGVGLNLQMGYTGMFNCAHGVLFGLGAYTSGLLVMNLGVNFWVTIPIAGITAVLIGFIIGYVTLRLRGLYFGLATLAFLFLMVKLYSSQRWLTGGEKGLYPIPPASIGGMTLGTEQNFIWVYIIAAFLLIAIFVVDRIVHSRIGIALIAIREDEDLAKSSGVNTFRYKMLAFLVGTFFAGVSGALYATYMSCVSPPECGFLPTLIGFGAVFVGGVGTALGPVVGTAVIQFLPELVRFSERYYYFIFSVLLITIILVAPKGIMGGIASLQARLRARGSREEARV